MPGARSLLYRTLVTVFLLCALSLRGQAPASAPSPPPLPEPVSLSPSSVPLTGPWRFQPGDSPVGPAGPLWAQPAFDDANWHSISLPAAGDVPGWLGRGYPKLDRGYAWYRLTLHAADAQQSLWLQMPADYDDAYQVYANGELLGGAGFRKGRQPVAYYARPHSFALPTPDAHGLITLAVRFWLDPNTHFEDPTAGGLHAAPRVGLTSAIRAAQQRDDTAMVLNKVAMEGFLPLFFLLSAAAAFWAWLRVRHEQAYGWLAIRLLINVAAAAVYDVALAGYLSASTATFLQDVVFRSVLTPLWIVFWWYWFKLERDRWILQLTAVITALDFLSALLARATVFGTVPAHWATWLSPANTLLKFAVLALLAIIFAKGFRSNRSEALLALVPLAINEVVIFNNFTLEGHFGWTGMLLGIYIPSNGIASFLLVLTIAILAVRRFLALHARQMLMQQTFEAELTQASELQKRVLLPETGQSAFFHVETAYLPAQIMGGDFFQVLSHADGSVLIVLGDVSGKGVTAAFLVAVLVGAIRTRAEGTFDPVSMLHMLNARLIDRSEGHFATCLALRIDASGYATVANAGHLPPYLNGREIPSTGALPLGLVANSGCEVSFLQLNPDDRLTLLSDGIVEAQGKHGELFGFDRTRDVSQGSAQEIAAAAQRFGQEDDITVVTVQFVGSAQAALTA